MTQILIWQCGYGNLPKGELWSKYYDHFSIFRQKIDSVIASITQENKSKINKLIGEKPQPVWWLMLHWKEYILVNKKST